MAVFEVANLATSLILFYLHVAFGDPMSICSSFLVNETETIREIENIPRWSPIGFFFPKQGGDCIILN